MGGLTFKLARAVGSTQEEFEERTPRYKRPEGSGVYDLTKSDIVSWAGIVDPEWLHIMPFGVGPERSTMLFRLWGWSAVEDREKLYIPTLLVDASAMLDVDGSKIQDGARMADNIAANDVHGPIPTVATFHRAIVVHARGSRWLQFEFAKPEGSEVESMNAFWKVGR